MGTIHANDPDNSAQFDVVNLRRSGEYKVRLFTTEFEGTIGSNKEFYDGLNGSS